MSIKWKGKQSDPEVKRKHSFSHDDIDSIVRDDDVFIEKFIVNPDDKSVKRLGKQSSSRLISQLIDKLPARFNADK